MLVSIWDYAVSQHVGIISGKHVILNPVSKGKWSRYSTFTKQTGLDGINKAGKGSDDRVSDDGISSPIFRKRGSDSVTGHCLNAHPSIGGIILMHVMFPSIAFRAEDACDKADVVRGSVFGGDAHEIG